MNRPYRAALEFHADEKRAFGGWLGWEGDWFWDFSLLGFTAVRLVSAAILPNVVVAAQEVGAQPFP